MPIIELLKSSLKSQRNIQMMEKEFTSLSNDLHLLIHSVFETLVT